MMIYESLNGELVSAGTTIFNSANRAFRYGDGFFETIRLHRGQPLFWNDHEERIHSSLKILGFSADCSNLKNEVELLAQRNNIISGRARATFFRDDGGYYKPDSGKGLRHIYIEPLDTAFGEAHGNGLSVGFYMEDVKSIGS